MFFFYKKSVPLLILTLLSGCNDEKTSNPITLYKNEIKTGNGIVNFVRFNDQFGSKSMEQCEELKELYIKKYKLNYFCSSINDIKYQPIIKWNSKSLD